jgi:sugar phosphate isomerase/epimerase
LLSDKIAVQIWPLRTYYGENISATFELIAQIGYKGVELCRWFTGLNFFDKWTPQEIVESCRQTGLRVISSHISYPMIFRENLDELIDFCKALNMNYVAVGMLPKELVTTHNDIQQIVDQFNQASSILEPEGISLGYHNHGFDFQPLAMDGSIPWRLFFDNTVPEVFMELDIGNALSCGVDPFYYLINYPGRVKLVHFREYSEAKAPAAIGDGDVDWVRIISLCEELHRTDWFVVEHEVKGYDPWKSAEQSYTYLKKLTMPRNNR